jgi:hypothetical protein
MHTRDDALRTLQRTWGEIYEISEALGVWRAVRLLNGRTVIATDPEALHALIVRDYAVEKVRRQTVKP